MSSETLVCRVLPRCQSELARLLDELDSAPSRTAFYDIGAVIEVLILSVGMPAAEPMLEAVRNAAARWLHSGLIEDLLVAHTEFTYHGALLCYLARDASSWVPSDMHVIRDLCNGRMIARSETPVICQRLIAAYLGACGVSSDFGQFGRRDLAKMVDRRVLRARSDEFDLLVLLLCAQLLQLEPGLAQARPKTLPQIQLVQALRSGNTNWVPVLTLLCRRFFELPEHLHRAALKSMEDSIPAENRLLPAPPSSCIDSEYISRTERGLRLRSTIALALTLDSPGELYDDSQLRAAYV